MVKIRLARRGRKKLALFDIVVANVTAPRDGRFIEKIGTYNPNTIPATIVLNEDSALNWLMTGAQPTDTTRAILSYRGILYKKHLQIGVNKGAITQEAADEKFNAWKEGKDSKISGRVDSLATAKADAAKVRLVAENKVNTDRKAAQDAKLAAEIAAANPAPAVEVAAEVAEAPAAEAVAEESPVSAEATPVESTPEVTEAPAAKAVVEETPVAEAVTEVVAETAVVEETAPEVVETPAAEVAPEEIVETAAAVAAEDTESPAAKAE